MAEKSSIEKIKEQIKQIDKKMIGIANATVKVQTSIQRKKNQLLVVKTAAEQDVDDAITNAE